MQLTPESEVTEAVSTETMFLALLASLPQVGKLPRNDGERFGRYPPRNEHRTKPMGTDHSQH